MKENISMKKDPMVMTLCGRCLSQFYFANCYRIRRKDECQCIKEDCTYCGCGKGYDPNFLRKYRLVGRKTTCGRAL